MYLNQVYKLGKDCAIIGGSINDCPYSDYEWKEKRAWVLGFIEGLRLMWERNK